MEPSAGNLMSLISLIRDPTGSMAFWGEQQIDCLVSNPKSFFPILEILESQCDTIVYKALLLYLSNKASVYKSHIDISDILRLQSAVLNLITSIDDESLRCIGLEAINSLLTSFPEILPAFLSYALNKDSPLFRTMFLIQGTLSNIGKDKIVAFFPDLTRILQDSFSSPDLCTQLAAVKLVSLLTVIFDSLEVADPYRASVQQVFMSVLTSASVKQMMHFISSLLSSIERDLNILSLDEAIPLLFAHLANTATDPHFRYQIQLLIQHLLSTSTPLVIEEDKAVQLIEIELTTVLDLFESTDSQTDPTWAFDFQSVLGFLMLSLSESSLYDIVSSKFTCFSNNETPSNMFANLLICSTAVTTADIFDELLLSIFQLFLRGLANSRDTIKQFSAIQIEFSNSTFSDIITSNLSQIVEYLLSYSPELVPFIISAAHSTDDVFEDLLHQTLDEMGLTVSIEDSARVLVNLINKSCDQSSAYIVSLYETLIEPIQEDLYTFYPLLYVTTALIYRGLPLLDKLDTLVRSLFDYMKMPDTDISLTAVSCFSELFSALPKEMAKFSEEAYSTISSLDIGYNKIQPLTEIILSPLYDSSQHFLAFLQSLDGFVSGEKVESSFAFRSLGALADYISRLSPPDQQINDILAIIVNKAFDRLTLDDVGDLLYQSILGMLTSLVRCCGIEILNGRQFELINHLLSVIDVVSQLSVELVYMNDVCYAIQHLVSSFLSEKGEVIWMFYPRLRELLDKSSPKICAFSLSILSDFMANYPSILGEDAIVDLMDRVIEWICTGNSVVVIEAVGVVRKMSKSESAIKAIKERATEVKEALLKRLALEREKGSSAIVLRENLIAGLCVISEIDGKDISDEEIDLYLSVLPIERDYSVCTDVYHFAGTITEKLRNKDYQKMVEIIVEIFSKSPQEVAKMGLNELDQLNLNSLLKRLLDSMENPEEALTRVIGQNHYKRAFFENWFEEISNFYSVVEGSGSFILE